MRSSRFSNMGIFDRLRAMLLVAFSHKDTEATIEELRKEMQNHHHRVEVDVTERLAHLLERLADKAGIYEELKLIKRGIKTIMATEQELDDKLTALGTAASDGFAAVNKAVSDAADRVIKALQKSPVDLTDEIASVEGIKTAVSDASAQAVANLAQIAPDNVPTTTEGTTE